LLARYRDGLCIYHANSSVFFPNKNSFLSGACQKCGCGVGDLHVPHASQEDDDDEPAKVEDEAASATEEEDWEEDNERSERRFGYDPDREIDVWEEYQAVMDDPMLAY
jgi:hypothetical protein